MKYSKYPVQPFRLDDEPSEEKEEKPQTDPGMLMKKLEKYFFETAQFSSGDRLMTVQPKTLSINSSCLMPISRELKSNF